MTFNLWTFRQKSQNFFREHQLLAIVLCLLVKAHPEYYQKLLICRALSKIDNYGDWKALEKRFIIQPITIAIAEPKIIGGSGTVLTTLPDPEIVFSNTP